MWLKLTSKNRSGSSVNKVLTCFQHSQTFRIALVFKSLLNRKIDFSVRVSVLILYSVQRMWFLIINKQLFHLTFVPYNSQTHIFPYLWNTLISHVGCVFMSLLSLIRWKGSSAVPSVIVKLINNRVSLIIYKVH